MFGSKAEQAFIRIEVSMPAARTALAAFANDRMKALETLTHNLRESVSSAVSDLLNAEMTLFLGQPEQADSYNQNSSKAPSQRAFR